MRAIEAFVALLVGFVVLAGGWAVLLHASVTARALRLEGERVETRRLVGTVLDAELAGARPDLDWWADPAGLRLRVFRGWGIACAGTGPGVVVAYRGLRKPEPDKDSLELVLADGRVLPVELGGSAGAGPDHSCIPASDTLRLRWPNDDAGALQGSGRPVLVRIYESGLYAVTDAFRYRRGAGGRQPLGPAVLDPRASHLEVRAGGPDVALAVPGRGRIRARTWIR